MATDAEVMADVMMISDAAVMDPVVMASAVMPAMAIAEAIVGGAAAAGSDLMLWHCSSLILADLAVAEATVAGLVCVGSIARVSIERAQYRSWAPMAAPTPPWAPVGALERAVSSLTTAAACARVLKYTGQAPARRGETFLGSSAGTFSRDLRAPVFCGIWSSPAIPTHAESPSFTPTIVSRNTTPNSRST